MLNCCRSKVIFYFYVSKVYILLFVKGSNLGLRRIYFVFVYFGDINKCYKFKLYIGNSNMKIVFGFF